MRFGRKSRNSSIFRRLARPEPEDGVFAAVAAEEREALLAPDADAAPPPDEAAMVHRDDDEMSPLDASENAAHSLLAALGMYHREVTRAKDGQAGPGWTDACMNQLINGVEISLENGWDDMAGALTETARILQTYDEAGRADDAVTFLDNVYDVLCLMGGNLLVGDLRSDVVDRWRAQHAKTLTQLEADGLALVSDDEERHMVRRAENGGAQGRASAPFDGAGIDDDAFPSVDAFAAEAAFVDEDDEDENGGDIVGVTIPDETAETPRPAAGTDDDTAQALDSLCAALSQWESDPQADREDVFGAVRECIGFLRELADDNRNYAAIPPCDALTRLTRQAAAMRQPDERFFELAYGFCDAYVQAQGEETSPETLSWIMECEALLIGMSAADEEEVASEPFDVPAAAADDEPAHDAEPIAEEPVVDVDIEAIAAEAAALEPVLKAEVDEEAVAGEADAEPAPETLETDAALDAFDAAEEPEAIKESADDETPELIPEQLDLDNDSPMRLLAIAQQAAAQGKTADARMLALTAAMRIATDEADECDRRLHEAEARLQAGSDAIERARNEVAAAESRVQHAEVQVGSGEAALAEQSEAIGGIETHIGEVEEAIADLDRRIAELIAQRDAEAERLAERRQDLENAQDERAAIESDLAARRNEEEAARLALENARQDVKASQAKRIEFESERDRTLEELNLTRTNLHELEQTIGMFTGKAKAKAEPEAPQEDLLF